MKASEFRKLIREEITKVLSEVKKEVITLTYNTDPDDLAYVKKVLKAAGIKAAVAAGYVDDEVLIIVEPGLEKKVIKALQKDGFDIN